ncbi:MAG: PEP-CTERM sorting domain-containing protein, partial [Planctomycetales bacterium]|nr:PEP-CTERM sorting domain-containing protein [Planctomycetales bacterium]
SWGEGDWDGDGLFGTSDFATAFQDGGYEAGPRPAVSAVPEPASLTLLLLGLLPFARKRK